MAGEERDARLVRLLGPGSQLLVVAAAAVVLAAGLRAASAAVVPVLLGAFLAVVSLPLLERLRRLRLPGGRRLPQGLAVLLTLLAGIGLALSLSLVVAESLREFARAAPRYEERLDAMIRDSRVWLAEKGVDVAAPRLSDLVSPQDVLGVFRGTAATVTRLLTQTLLVVLVLAFALMEAPRLPARLHAAFGESARVEERLAKIAREIQTYLRVKTLTSLATGLVFGLWLALLGVDYAPLWGFLAFILNYVPHLGSIAAALPPTFVGLVQLGPGAVVAIVLGSLVVNQVISNLVEPHLMGRSLRLSPLVVILSLVWWGYILGAAGILLAVPVTTSLKILLENTEDLRWLAALLESEPK
jgi:predicted PurR-regulated permease PerM